MAGAKLELRQSQSLVMTAQLQQSIRLLQYSTAELQEFIAEELEKNPLLQDDGGTPAVEDAPLHNEESEKPSEPAENADEGWSSGDWQEPAYASGAAKRRA